MVRLAVTPAVTPANLKLPVVPVAPAATPRTTFEFCSMTTAPPAGTVPVFQFEPTVQSLLVAPVQPCAAADRGESAASAATETLIRSRRSKCARDENRVRRGLRRGLSFACRRIV